MVSSPYITHLPRHSASLMSVHRALCGQLVERRHILRPNDLRPLRCASCQNIKARQDMTSAEPVKAAAKA